MGLHQGPEGCRPVAEHAAEVLEARHLDQRRRGGTAPLAATPRRRPRGRPAACPRCQGPALP
eukprot:2971866-Lingulodinium_polyedra.AAC.1